MAVEKFTNHIRMFLKQAFLNNNHKQNQRKQKRKVVVQLTRFEKVLYISLITVIALISIMCYL